MTYPIKYAVLELKIEGDLAIDYEDITIGYIVSKCYVLEERINYPSKDRKYVVSFPYDGFQYFKKWIERNQKNYKDYMAVLYKRYYEERKDPNNEHTREGYPIHIVNKLFTSYEEAKEVADRKNNCLKGEILDNTGRVAYQKLSKKFEYTMEICGEYEKYIFANTTDMEVTKKTFKVISEPYNENKDSKEKQLSNELKEMAASLFELYELEYQQIKGHVEYIIDNNIYTMSYIEQVLERLLNIPYEPCYQLFLKLCDYVSKFNQQIAYDYLDLWDDLYGEDKPKIKVKK